VAPFRLAPGKAVHAGTAGAASHIQPIAAHVEERARNKQWWIEVRAFEWIFRQFRSLGPYLAIELVLPGGSIAALLLWTYRHRSAARQTVTRIEKTLTARRGLSLDPDLSRCSRSN
jgi:hypothetical protein